VFAALTSAISLLEVIASYFIDQWKWTRHKATLLCAAAVTLFGIPSALSNNTDLFGADFAEWKAGLIGDEWGAITKNNWFDTLDYLVSNWMLPLGGLFIAVFAAWRVSSKAREAEFLEHSHAGRLFKGWLILLRYLVPAVVIVVCLNAAGLLAKWGTIQAVEGWFKKLFG
jgi:NSS family neurotransmitter:Na+ symporter